MLLSYKLYSASRYPSLVTASVHFRLRMEHQLVTRNVRSSVVSVYRFVWYCYITGVVLLYQLYGTVLPIRILHNAGGHCPVCNVGYKNVD